MEDITETRTLELQLRQAQKMEAIGRLAGGIAHDFNNLLMVISGYSEFLLERLGSDPQLRGPAQEISNATERATSLTRQLLAFSRKQMLAPKVLDLNEVVTENLKMLTRMIGEDIDLVMVPGPGSGAVRADPGQIDQVIMNLAVNAPRRHAARRQAHHRDRQRHARRELRAHSPARSPPATTSCSPSATPASAWTTKPSRASSSLSSPPRAPRAPASASLPCTAS